MRSVITGNSGPNSTSLLRGERKNVTQWPHAKSQPSAMYTDKVDSFHRSLCVCSSINSASFNDILSSDATDQLRALRARQISAVVSLIALTQRLGSATRTALTGRTLGGWLAY